MIHSNRLRHPKQRRPAFTLFELILAIALSVTLLVLIGMTIDLYLTRIDASRSEVEEAQLARSVLSMIADDIRSTTIYKPQDTSSLMALAASTAAFDVDSIDKPKASSGASGSTGASGVSTNGGSQVIKTTKAAGGSSSKSSSGSGGSSSSNSSNADGGLGASNSMPLGLNGTDVEIYIDSSRLPNMEELFASATGYANANVSMAAADFTTSTIRPSDIKSVCYFIREEDAFNANSGDTVNSQEPQDNSGGLVRQEVDRAARTWAEQTGNQAVLDSGKVLIAPEVTSIEFRYFDGSQITDTWDMAEVKTLPKAIEVRIWISSSGNTTSADGSESAGREYRQTVYLPMASLAGNGSSATTSGGSTKTDASSASSASSGSSFGGSP